MIQSILIDQREPEHIQKMSFDNAPTVVTLLEHGDLHVLCGDGTLLIIERKTPSDLLNSLRDNRLIGQCASLLSMGGWPYLVIDGQFQRGPQGNVFIGGRETGWHWGALQGALLTIQELGVFVVTAADDFEHTVLWLAKHQHGDVKVAARRKAIFSTPQEQVIASLPGFDETKACALLSNHRNNLTWALCSLLDPEWKQSGVGPATIKNLRRLFALEDNETLWPMYNDQPLQKEQIK